MKRLIHFFSLAVMTQLILMLSQLILLPLQLRMWGQAATAHWYSALALATITFVVDCGLRTAGHAELLKANDDPEATPAEAHQFRQIWGWIRVLVLMMSTLLIVGDFVAIRFVTHTPYPLWRAGLIIACALETALVIRITYLDSLGQYRGSEASYFSFAVLRLTFSFPALLIFHWNVTGLTGIYIVSGAIALFVQGQWLCRSTPLIHLSAGLPRLSWRILALSRYTVAEPLANWTRLSLPVLVIGQIAAPVAVTTYVALRAVFGAGRSTIQQLARVASVEVLRAGSSGETTRADAMLTLFIVAAIFFGSGVGAFVVIDHMRILGLWLKHFDPQLFAQTALALALTAPLFSYQIPMNMMFRMGQLAQVARRHYAFVIYSCLFAGVSLLVRSFPAYLAMLVVAETILSVSFLEPARAGLRVAAGAALAQFVLWYAAQQNLGGAFDSFSFRSLAESASLLILLTGATAGLLYRSFGVPFMLLRGAQSAEPPLAMAK